MGEPQKDKHDWSKSFGTKTKAPYQVSIFRDLLGSYFSGKAMENIGSRVNVNLRTERGSNNDIYVFVGMHAKYSWSDCDTLIQFVEKGGQAVLSAYDFPEKLAEQLNISLCNEDFNYDINGHASDTIVYTNFVNPTLKDSTPYDLYFYEKYKKEYNTWNFIKETSVCSQYPMVVLATCKAGYADGASMVRFDIGKGQLYFVSTPLAFTNFHIIRKRGVEFASKIVSHLKPGNIIWDNVSSKKSKNEDDDDEENEDEKKTPLSFILAQPELKWAVYLLLALGLLYLLFGSKRRQRIIPVLEEKSNTSLNFTKTIGELYYQQNNHRLLAVQMMKVFLNGVRERYRLNTNKLDGDFSKSMSLKSGIPEEKIREILSSYSFLESQASPSNQDLLEFYYSLDYFYHNKK